MSEYLINSSGSRVHSRRTLSAVPEGGLLLAVGYRAGELNAGAGLLPGGVELVPAGDGDGKAVGHGGVQAAARHQRLGGQAIHTTVSRKETVA